MQTAPSIVHSPEPFSTVGYHRWRDLLFLHWKVPPERLQPLLPARLNVETFDGLAWVGLVAFDMSGVRPKWFPALPGVSAFHETNVRTYVNLDGERPGVWFFSLDAAASLAVHVARRRWHLNYFRSRMTLRREGRRVCYSSRRLWPGTWDAGYDIEATIAEEIPSPAQPQSLEHFLVERYVMYAQRRDGSLLRGRVRHTPYPIRSASATRCTESLIAAAGIEVDGPAAHTVFSDGVDVEIGGLQPV